jgi:hypothetical protein|tara:strand:- start:277 stop:528 length:252 start_codon:yes stop_codon:yes gene_type:complete
MEAMEFKLTNQAVGAIMMLLQKAILNTLSDSDDIDIVETLKEFQLVSTEEGLVVKNPPVLFMSNMKNDLFEHVDTEADTIKND